MSVCNLGWIAGLVVGSKVAKFLSLWLLSKTRELPLFQGICVCHHLILPDQERW